MPVPDQVRDDGSGIQKRNTLNNSWIPGQARNDKRKVQPLSEIGGKIMTRKLFYIFAILFIVSTASAGDGLISFKSSHDVKVTADRLEDILINKKMNVFIRIDHAAGAKKVGQKLRPTELVVFGNPKVGTPLMQCSQSVAIDLPQKALIWQDAKGQVWLTYNDPNYLAQRHGLSECADVIKKVEKALNNFAKAATMP